MQLQGGDCCEPREAVTSSPVGPEGPKEEEVRVKVEGVVSWWLGMSE